MLSKNTLFLEQFIKSLSFVLEVFLNGSNKPFLRIVFENRFIMFCKIKNLFKNLKYLIYFFQKLLYNNF